MKLPSSEQPNAQYVEYWVSLEQQQGSEEFSCKSSYNAFLTLKAISAALRNRIAGSDLRADDYSIADDHFQDRLVIKVKQFAEGSQTIELQPYFLRSSNKFGLLVDFHFATEPGQAFTRRIQQLSLSLDKAFQSNRNYYSDKYDKLTSFITTHLQHISPLVIGEKSHQLDSELLRMLPSSLDKRIYQFHSNTESSSQFLGLKQNSPLVTLSRQPLFVFIFTSELKPYANELYSAMKGKSYPTTFPGLNEIFGINITTSDVLSIIVPSIQLQDLIGVEPELTRLQIANPDRQLIGIFLQPTRDDEAQHSPYYFLKSVFLRKNLPLQVVTIERMKGKDGLKWSIANICLQIFAKLGGIPWCVKPRNEKCIIFGLGSSHQRSVEGNITRYLAYSVCLDSSGIYKRLDTLGEADSKHEYLELFKTNITTTIRSQLQSDSGLTTCVIHAPFKIRRDELRGIEQAIEQLTTSHQAVRFVCIKINTKNRFFGFAENNSRVPYESSYIQLSNSEYLIWLEGLHYGKENVNKRIGNPIHVEFIYPSSQTAASLTEIEKQSFLQDIINLSGANWRGFNAKLAPISIFYPELIASYLAAFQQMPTPHDVNITHMNQPWFL